MSSDSQKERDASYASCFTCCVCKKSKKKKDKRGRKAYFELSNGELKCSECHAKSNKDKRKASNSSSSSLALQEVMRKRTGKASDDVPSLFKGAPFLSSSSMHQQSDALVPFVTGPPPPPPPPQSIPSPFTETRRPLSSSGQPPPLSLFQPSSFAPAEPSFPSVPVSSPGVAAQLPSVPVASVPFSSPDVVRSSSATVSSRLTSSAPPIPSSLPAPSFSTSDSRPRNEVNDVEHFASGDSPAKKLPRSDNVPPRSSSWFDDSVVEVVPVNLRKNRFVRPPTPMRMRSEEDEQSSRIVYDNLGNALAQVADNGDLVAIEEQQQPSQPQIGNQFSRRAQKRSSAPPVALDDDDNVVEDNRRRVDCEGFKDILVDGLEDLTVCACCSEFQTGCRAVPVALDQVKEFFRSNQMQTDGPKMIHPPTWDEAGVLERSADGHIRVNLCSECFKPKSQYVCLERADFNVHGMGWINGNQWMTWPEMQVLATVNSSGLCFQHAQGDRFLAYLTKGSCNIRCFSFNVIEALRKLFLETGPTVALVSVQFAFGNQGLGGMDNFKCLVRKKTIAHWFLVLWNTNEFYHRQVLLNNACVDPSDVLMRALEHARDQLPNVQLPRESEESPSWSWKKRLNNNDNNVPNCLLHVTAEKIVWQTDKSAMYVAILCLPCLFWRVNTERAVEEWCKRGLKQMSAHLCRLSDCRLFNVDAVIYVLHSLLNVQQIMQNTCFFGAFFPTHLKPVANLDELERSLSFLTQMGRRQQHAREVFDDDGSKTTPDDPLSVALLFRHIRTTGATLNGMQMKKHEWRNRSYAIALQGRPTEPSMNLWLTINVNVATCSWLDDVIERVVRNDDLELKSRVIRAGLARSLFYSCFNNAVEATILRGSSFFESSPKAYTMATELTERGFQHVHLLVAVAEGAARYVTRQVPGVGGSRASYLHKHNATCVKYDHYLDGSNAQLDEQGQPICPMCRFGFPIKDELNQCHPYAISWLPQLKNWFNTIGGFDNNLPDANRAGGSLAPHQFGKSIEETHCLPTVFKYFTSYSTKVNLSRKKLLKLFLECVKVVKKLLTPAVYQNEDNCALVVRTLLRKVLIAIADRTLLGEVEVVHRLLGLKEFFCSDEVSRVAVIPIAPFFNFVNGKIDLGKVDENVLNYIYRGDQLEHLTPYEMLKRFKRQRIGKKAAVDQTSCNFKMDHPAHETHRLCSIWEENTPMVRLILNGMPAEYREEDVIDLMCSSWRWENGVCVFSNGNKDGVREEFVERLRQYDKLYDSAEEGKQLGEKLNKVTLNPMVMTKEYEDVLEAYRQQRVQRRIVAEEEEQQQQVEEPSVENQVVDDAADGLEVLDPDSLVELNDHDALLKMRECGFLPPATANVDPLPATETVALLRTFSSRFGLCSDENAKRRLLEAWTEKVHQRQERRNEERDKIAAEQQMDDEVQWEWNLPQPMLDQAKDAVKASRCWEQATDEQKVALSLPISQLASTFCGTPNLRSRTIVIQGAAGTGKTATVIEGLKIFINQLVAQVDDDDNLRERLQKSVLILAVTNRASAAIGGATYTTGFLNGWTPKDKQQKILCSPFVEMVIFEEFSMMSLSMLNEMEVNLQKLKKSGPARDFGGVTMVCIGDIFQLEPIQGVSVIHTQDFLEKVSTTPKELASVNGAALWHNYKRDAQRDYYVVRVNEQFRLQGDLRDAVSELRKESGLSNESAQLMVNLCNSRRKRRRVVAGGRVIHKPEHACLASDCDGCIALFQKNSTRVSIGLVATSSQGALLCPEQMVHVQSRGVSGPMHDNEQVLYPGMLARANVNEKGTFLLNGNNCVVMSIFPEEEEEVSMASIQGQRMRHLTKCPSFVAVCSPQDWKSIAARLRDEAVDLEQYCKLMVELIQNDQVMLVKATAVDTGELGGKKGERQENLPRHCIPLTPACVGTVYKLQGATIRGRVVIDLNNLKPTQAVYTAITRATISDLLTLVPQTDLTQWKQLRFAQQVYDEHFYLTREAIKTLHDLPRDALDFLDNNLELVERVKHTANQLYDEMVEERRANKNNSGAMVAVGGMVSNVKIVNVKVPKTQTNVTVPIYKEDYRFENLLFNLNSQALLERFRVFRREWISCLDSVRDEEIRYRLARGLFVEWCVKMETEQPQRFKRKLSDQVKKRARKQLENDWKAMLKRKPRVKKSMSETISTNNFKIEEEEE